MDNQNQRFCLLLWNYLLILKILSLVLAIGPSDAIWLLRMLTGKRLWCWKFFRKPAMIRTVHWGKSTNSRAKSTNGREEKQDRNSNAASGKKSTVLLKFNANGFSGILLKCCPPPPPLHLIISSYSCICQLLVYLYSACILYISLSMYLIRYREFLDCNLWNMW